MNAFCLASSERCFGQVLAASSSLAAVSWLGGPFLFGNVR